ncbi:hypothetical protein IVA93_37395 (plasmid) [Bradyrhizobium sp. 155]|uniref:hypothetical protein n=1 Tax=Bradyrhizobium sp. 155 TaxID=2782629 RepID=UPI001FFE5D2A|nr:hypothetical protein [Bradyrhizobium sp. 155]UPK15790.1 hypothetical protein IVA93_37395 [Bradyrhizobium sp. 155]
MQRGSLRISGLIAAIVVLPAAAAYAQVDPNLQVRIETLTPPRDRKPDLPETEIITKTRVQTYTTKEVIDVPPEEQQRRLDKVLAEKGLMLPMTTDARDRAIKRYGLDRETRTVRKKKVVTESVVVAKPRETRIVVGATTQSVFDTNAAKTPHAVGDTVFGTTGSITVNVPVGVADSFIFQTGVNDQRYAKLVAKNVDILFNSATYNQVLKIVAPGKTDGTTTSDVMSYSLGSSTVYGSGFNPYLVELFTPSIAWARNNMDFGGTLCGVKGNEAFCIAGTFVAEGEFTFSDVATQRNASSKLVGGVTWQTPVAGLTASAGGFIQGRHFTEFPGGRDDLILQASARADWVSNANVQLSGVLQVTQQFSTVKVLEWNGLAVFPYLKLKVTF